MNLIAAADRNFGIGKNGNLLARIPEDMKFFRKKTEGGIVVMGSRTYLSLPKRPLPERENVVLTSEPERFPEAVCFETVGDFLKYAKKAEKEIYVCGGGMVYLQLLPYCEKAFVTKIDAAFDADTFLPKLDELSGWELAEQSEPTESNGYSIRFTVYRNKSVRPMAEPLMEELCR